MTEQTGRGASAGAAHAAASQGGLLDADRFLSLTEGLRDVHARLDGSRLANHEKTLWQRRLLSISDDAALDLTTAERELATLVADLDRRLGDRS